LAAPKSFTSEIKRKIKKRIRLMLNTARKKILKKELCDYLLLQQADTILLELEEFPGKASFFRIGIGIRHSMNFLLLPAAHSDYSRFYCGDRFTFYYLEYLYLKEDKRTFIQ
jgi:hypothetical protein